MKFFIKVLIFYFLILVWMSSCTTMHVKPKYIDIPPEPYIFPVEVYNGTISGKNLDNMRTNWINTHQYIDDLINLGAFKKPEIKTEANLYNVK